MNDDKFSDKEIIRLKMVLKELYADLEPLIESDFNTLVNELRKLFIGESMPREDRAVIKEIIRGYDDVVHINRIQTMAMGKNKYLVLISINLNDYL